jgi:hypothetical protein
VVNLLARCSAFPYEKDQALINRFQQLSLVTIDQLIDEMDAPQLVSAPSLYSIVTSFNYPSPFLLTRFLF